MAELKFRGRFDAKIDEKGRLLLPLALREVLNEFPLVVTNNQSKKARFLDGYSFPYWQQLENRIDGLSPLKLEVQAFQRFYLANAQVLSPDAQNRILLPKNLREFGQLGSDVVIIGMSEKIEIWEQKTWTKLYQDLANSFEDTVALVADLEQQRDKK
ncbi:MAG: division/cell wall cluster transcriptional repressor MraZ [Pseudomonadota bacterium]|nr:division/cell wall cluster transcriptional repressor MraZ [Pseudomonadota bacterium]